MNIDAATLNCACCCRMLLLFSQLVMSEYYKKLSPWISEDTWSALILLLGGQENASFDLFTLMQLVALNADGIME